MSTQNVQISEANTFPIFFCFSFLCRNDLRCAELVVGVCLNEGPEASLNGTEDHMNASLFVTGKRRKKRTKSMCMETRSALNLNKLLNFWPSQKLKYFFVTFINVSEPSVQYIPSTNSTLKGISTQKPEAKIQVSEIMAKQIIKGNVRETSIFFFNIIYDSNWDCGFSKQKWTVSAH